VTFTASVSALSGFGTPTGSVDFYDGANKLGTEPLQDGLAAFTTPLLALAGHSISARYQGDNNFTKSQFDGVPWTVNPDGSQASVSSSVNPSVYGQAVTFTATVSAAAPGVGIPTGTVSFLNGGDSI